MFSHANFQKIKKHNNNTNNKIIDNTQRYIHFYLYMVTNQLLNYFS